MSWAYLHIAVNHFPIIGVIIGALLLMGGIFFDNSGIKISGLSTILFASIMALVAYYTGGPAKNAVEALPGFTKSVINRHEDIAVVSLYLIIPAGLIAAMTLYSIWKKEKSVKFLLVSTLVLSILSSGAMLYAGKTGGEIRHSEFQSNSVQLRAK